MWSEFLRKLCFTLEMMVKLPEEDCFTEREVIHQSDGLYLIANDSDNLRFDNK